jgi:lipopolysaccharide export system permease protein
LPRPALAATVRPLMRLLDRYLLRELLLPLAYCLGGFLVSFIAFDLFNSIADLQRANLSPGDILEYYLHRTPEFLVTSYVMPMSLLLALLYALTTHARHHELTAMRAAAIPLWRITLPYFAVGLVFSAVVFFLNEKLVPDGLEAAERLKSRRADAESKEAQKVWKRSVFFLNPVDNRRWNIGAFHLQQNVMWHPQFDWRRADGTLLRVTAERALWTRRQWVFTNVEQLEFTAEVNALPTITKLETLIVPGLTETPRVIKSEIKISGLDSLRSLRKTQLTSTEILDYLRLHPQLERQKRDSLETMLHARFAAPLICLVVVLIAVPFGAQSGRRNAFVGVASSVGICFVFFVMKEFAVALGSGGYVAPWLAAWTPNALFALTGLVLMWRVR